MHIEFITRVGSPSPYVGVYQFQDMTIEEKKMYVPILKKVFPNFDELAKIWFREEQLREQLGL